jgi:hypothetical protein
VHTIVGNSGTGQGPRTDCYAAISTSFLTPTPSRRGEWS